MPRNAIHVTDRACFPSRNAGLGEQRFDGFERMPAGDDPGVRVFAAHSRERQPYERAPSERFELDLEQIPVGERRRVAQ